jgi:NAD(P)-dependent dehydrogenase (short-subunit alcohol dehydrogenase family)
VAPEIPAERAPIGASSEDTAVLSGQRSCLDAKDTDRGDLFASPFLWWGLAVAVALVTGASRGIGRAAAVALAGAGLDVALAARTAVDGTARLEPGSDVVVPGGLDSTARAVEAAGARALVVPMDLLDRASVEAAVIRTEEALGPVDVLVNNAVFQGAGTLAPFVDLTEPQLHDVFEGNVFAPLALVRAVLPGMRERGGGTIVNVVSGAGVQDPPARVGEGGWSLAYAMSKASLGRVAPLLHVEHGGEGVRVFSVDPGLTVTERMEAAGRADLYRRHYQAATPDEIGRVIAWLVTDPAADELRGTWVHAQAEARRRGL